MDHPADDALTPELVAGDPRAWQHVFDRLAVRLYQRALVRGMRMEEATQLRGIYEVVSRRVWPFPASRPRGAGGNSDPEAPGSAGGS